MNSSLSQQRQPRILLLTHYAHYNYGGVLQAYATIALLMEHGLEVQVPAYFPNGSHCAKHFRGTGLNCLLKGKFTIARDTMLSFALSFSRRRSFDQFRNEHIPIDCGLSDRTIPSTCEYDLVLIGSDNVWNNSLNRDDLYYFGDSIQREHLPVASYASTFGCDEGAANIANVIPYLQRFSFLGVRGEKDADRIRKASDLEPRVVCDPTLLWAFDELDAPMQHLPATFVLVYACIKEHEEGLRVVCQAVAKEMKAPIVCLASEKTTGLSWADIILRDAGPAEWVAAIKRASVLVTDSFHGMVFATKFKIPFLAHVQGWRRERLYDFATRSGSECRIISDPWNFNFSQHVCLFDRELKVSPRLEKEIEDSRTFLFDSLATVLQEKETGLHGGD